MSCEGYCRCCCFPAKTRVVGGVRKGERGRETGWLYAMYCFLLYYACAKSDMLVLWSRFTTKRDKHIRAHVALNKVVQLPPSGLLFSLVAVVGRHVLSSGLA
ncbi:hypothetical protein B0T19DRAFT_426192 [Cercophora scortea]|uniref:Uncharacterized protein n=1 Tax=Cercophora scortea TaxID=314031 RepID=A0AAE0M955_9PEZI|nr:hypothetical protein B0T19DRAFT_426192 [Cercophora scortea]